MVQKLVRMFDVKSIVTVTLTAVFAYLSATGKVDTNQFLTVFTVIIAFYFGTQSQKPAAGPGAASGGKGEPPAAPPDAPAK